jgi:chemotaxis protein CheD
VNLAPTTKDIVVPMAGIAVGNQNVNLRTLLGSCVGIALYDSKLKIGGLAHIVMPDSAGKTNPLGKYADTAIPETIRQLKSVAGNSRMTLSAKIAGGANMFSGIANSSQGFGAIGDRNCEAVEMILDRLRIPILARHLGGDAGRKMVLFVHSGQVEIIVLGEKAVLL